MTIPHFRLKAGAIRISPLFGLFKSQRFHDSELRRKHRRSLSPEFQRTFALEVLKTERLRVIALIGVATVVVVYIVVATAVGLGTVDPRRLATGYVIFVLFEAT